MRPRRHRLQIWTSRYGNPNVGTSGLNAVGITRGAPRFQLPYDLKANLYDLAPTYRMIHLSKTEGRQAFTKAYTEHLDRLGIDRVLRQLEVMQNGAPGIVLLCYEDLTDGESWCHRQLLAGWLHQHADLEIQELPDPGNPRAKKKKGTRE